jgi:hypothetical protein
LGAIQESQRDSASKPKVAPKTFGATLGNRPTTIPNRNAIVAIAFPCDHKKNPAGLLDRPDQSKTGCLG